MRRLRENRTGAVSESQDEKSYTSLRHSKICRVQQRDSTVVTMCPECRSYHSQGAARLAIGSACRQHSPNIFKENQAAATLISEPDKFFKKHPAGIVEPFLQSSTAPRLAGRTPNHQRDLSTAQTRTPQNPFRGKVPHIAVDDLRVFSKLATLNSSTPIPLQGCDCVRFQVGSKTPLPPGSLQTEIQSTSPRK